jgi:hypothetical protein
MIISALTHHHAQYRPYSAKGAVASVLDAMKVGETVDVKKVVDSEGADMSLSRFQITISALRGARVFKTRAAPAPLLATIYRVA